MALPIDNSSPLSDTDLATVRALEEAIDHILSSNLDVKQYVISVDGSADVTAMLERRYRFAGWSAVFVPFSVKSQRFTIDNSFTICKYSGELVLTRVGR
jgi:hypothetical protein